jgi:hypothetical protein
MKHLYGCYQRFFVLNFLGLILFAFSLLGGQKVEAQIAISSLPATYTQDFDNYLGTAASLPTGWTAAFSGTVTYRGVGTGTSNSGGAWAYGNSSENALGALRSGTPGNITYTVTFQNTSGTTITSLTFSWQYEQWRFVNLSGINCSATGAIAGNATVDSKDLTGSNSGTNGTPLITNVSSFTINGLSIANGATFGVSFVTTDDTGEDNGLAIDNFVMSASSCITATIAGGSPSPTSQSVCLNGTPTNLSISLSTGTSPTYQWYSNTVNSYTGSTLITGATSSTYTPPTTVAGTTYYYCVVTACSNSVTSSIVSVTVNTPATATISYPGTPFCSNSGLHAVTRTGTAGGTYSASPAGLSINSSTGEINAGLSTAGTYTVTYTIAATGGCAAQNFTTSVTITALPAATISYSAASFCKTAGVQTVTRTGTAGGTYTASPAGLSINASTGAITPSTSTEGTYTVTYTMAAPGNGCTVDQTATATVAIKSTVTSIAPAAVQDIPVDYDGTQLTVSEGDVVVSRQWKYGTTPGGPYSFNLGTGNTETPNFSSVGTYYIVCESTYPATPCGGITVRSNEVQVNVTNNTIITDLASFGPFCNNTANNVTVGFTYSPAANFTAGTAVFTAQLSDASGSFASPTNIGTVVSNASGSQSISATIPAGISGGTNFRIRVRSTNPNSTGTDNDDDFSIGNFPSATISYPGSPFCTTAGTQTVNRTGTAGGTYSASPAGLTIDPSTGNIIPTTSTPGSYTVTYTIPVVGSCPSYSTTTTVTVTAAPAANIAYVTSPFCSNSGVQTVTRTGTSGGTYSASPAGLSINATTGDITPTSSTAGTYIVTYTMAASGGCAAQTASNSVTITQAPAATISYTGTPFCSNDYTSKTVTRTGTSGGTFTASPAGLSINASTGTIDIFSSSTGTYTITYSMSAVGGCPVQTTTTNITINAAPTVADIVAGSNTITAPTTTNVTNATPGGTWSSSNTSIATVSGGGVVTPHPSNVGSTVINYSVTSGGCTTVVGTAINVLSASGVNIWSNTITGTSINPATNNPYTTGDVVNSNVSVSGIGYLGVTAVTANDRYTGSNWPTSASPDLGKYFTFTLTSDAGYAIDFTSFAFSIQTSAQGPNTIVVRSSIDGFASNIATYSYTTGTTQAYTVSLTGAAYQNISSPVIFRIYGYNASGTGGTLSVNDFIFSGNLRILCPSPVAIEFIAQPTFTEQNQVMSPVLVRAKCASGITAAAFTGPVVLTVNNGCGYTTQTVNAVKGVAVFSNVVFTRSTQSDVRLQAFSSGLGTVLSDTFSITAPTGVPTNTVIVSEDFEGATQWAYTAGTAVAVGSGGTAGTDVVAIKNFSGNNSLVKSYSVNNASGELGSQNTITFANQTISGTYSHATFSFQIASLGTGGVGSGAGHDNGEQMYIEVSLDGGTQWNRLLTYNGNSDYLFPFASTPVTTLAYNANAVYNKPSAQSAFRVQLPSGTTQFRFRMTGTNNRTNENWAIDNISLVGTSAPAGGIINPLPTVTSNTLTSCPSTNTTATVAVDNAVGVVSYVWTPATFISNTTVSNPTVNPPAAAVYTANITDGDGCKATGTFTINMPSGTTGTWTGAANTDWFQCVNWGGGVVPGAATAVTIPAAATNAADIDPLSIYAASYSGIAATGSLTINGKTVTTQANSVLNVNGNFTLQNAGGVLDMTNGGTLNLTGSWTKSGGATFTSGTGAINYAGTAAQTIAAENYYDLTSSSTGTRTLANAGTIGVSNIFTPGSNTYTVTGSTVDFNKAGFSQNVPAFTFYNVGFKNGGTKTLTGAISVQKTLTVGAATTFTLSSYDVTLKSTASLTANVATVPSGATINQAGTGRFVVERYFDALRSWRLVTTPVFTSQTLKDAWMEGATPATLPSSNPNPSPTFGTHITGPSPAANGFDYSPQNSYSIKYYNGSNWTGTGLTTNSFLTSRAGWMLFVRGDRSYPILTTTAYTTPQTATLRARGTINVGDRPLLALSAGMNVVGNPYPSAFNFSSVTKVPAAAANDIYYVWDPRLGSQGQWVTLTRSTGTTYSPNVTPASPIDLTAGRIESGQAFMVSSSNLTSITIKETDKSDVSALLFRPVSSVSNNSSLQSTLYLVNEDGTKTTYDGTLQYFDKTFSNVVDATDAIKPVATGEGLGIAIGDKVLSFERRQLPVAGDTVFYNIARMRAKKYTLAIQLNNISADNLVARLEDNYARTSVPVLLNGKTEYAFEVADIPGAYATDRIRLVFRKLAGFINVKAESLGKSVGIMWQSTEENGVNTYTIERSTNGTSFSTAGIVQANVKNNGYSFIDNDIQPGLYYYRIKAEGTEAAAVAYSETIQVKVIRSNAPMIVFPNPVRGNTIQLQMNQQPQGYYTVRMYNSTGQLTTAKLLSHPGGTATHSISIDNALSDGNYQIEITGSNKKTSVLPVVVQQ